MTTTENLPSDEENQIDVGKHHTYSHSLTLINVTKEYSGNYSCHFPETKNETISTQPSYTVVAIQLPTIKSPLYEEIRLKEKEGKSFSLSCTVEAFPTELFKNSIKWEKETSEFFEENKKNDAAEINSILPNKTNISSNNTHITALVIIEKASKKHNGTYICSVSEPITLDIKFSKEVQKKTSIIIQSPPIVEIIFAKSIGKNRIFLNWTGKLSGFYFLFSNNNFFFFFQ